MDTATAIMKNAVVENHSAETIVDIYESDRVLYLGCEFRGITLIFRDKVNPTVLRDCLLRDCMVLAPDNSKEVWLAGYNTMLGGSFNGSKVEEFRTCGLEAES